MAAWIPIVSPGHLHVYCVTDPLASGLSWVSGAQSSWPVVAPAAAAQPVATSIITKFFSTKDVKKMIRPIARKFGGYKKFRKFLKKSYSLYLRDTGGQVEFQEMISLLIFGPSIFFFVF
jgi:hypothetical protein